MGSMNDNYTHQWYTWVISGLLILAIVFVYLKWLRPMCCKHYYNNSNDSLSNHEYEQIGSNGKKGRGTKSLYGHYNESTDMIPDTPNGYANGRYKYLQNSLKSISNTFLKQLISNKKENYDNNNNNNCEMNNKTEFNKINNENTNIINVNNTNIVIGSNNNNDNNNNNSNNNAMINEFGSELEPILENYGENGIKYESLQTMPFVESSIADTSIVKPNNNNNNNSMNNSNNCNNNNNNHSKRLFQIKMEGHSIHKIPFIVQNTNDTTDNDNMSDDSGVYTDDLNSDSNSKNSDILASNDDECVYDSYDESQQYL